jgi:hypothetical protein
VGKAKSAEVAANNFEAYMAAYDSRHRDWLLDADKFNRYYLGEQWDEADRKALEAQGRPVLTINEILTTVNAVLGEHGDNRVDFRFKARHAANEETAEVLTHVVDHILDQNNYSAQEAQVFADGVISDAGYFDVRMNFDRNVMGEVSIESVDPMDVVLDGEAKEYDNKTWTRVFRARWHTLDEIEALYDKKARKEVEGLVLAGSTYGQGSVRFMDEKRFGDDGATVPTGNDALSQLRGLRVIEQQQRKLVARRMFVDLETGDMKAIPENWDEERIEQVVAEYGLGVMKKVTPRVRWTVTCDHVVLHDEWSPYEDFTIVPFFPLFRRGRFSGLVRQLMSPQDQLNKVESQQLHVVNTTANSGWQVEEGSLANMTPEELEQRGAETGLVQVFRRGRLPPTKIQPNQIPSGLDRLGSKALQFIHEISGVEALQGAPPKSTVSGVAIERSQSRALIKLGPMLDNLSRSRRMVAERVLKLIQQYYNETRIMRVTDWRSPTEEEVDVVINQPTPVGTILNDVTVGEYDVVVGTAPAREGALDTEFAEALQLREAGVMIPDEVVIRASHLARKHEVAATVMEMQGRGEPSSEEAQLMQMQQEMEMQGAQLALMEMEAKIEKIQAEAQQLMAKAQSIGVDSEVQPAKAQAEIQLAMERLQFEIAKAEADMQNKLQLARTHTESRNAAAVMQMMAKRVDTERKMQGQRDIAQISARAANQRPKG